MSSVGQFISTMYQLLLVLRMQGPDSAALDLSKANPLLTLKGKVLVEACLVVLAELACCPSLLPLLLALQLVVPAMLPQAARSDLKLMGCLELGLNDSWMARCKPPLNGDARIQISDSPKMEAAPTRCVLISRKWKTPMAPAQPVVRFSHSTDLTGALPPFFYASSFRSVVAASCPSDGRWWSSCAV